MTEKMQNDAVSTEGGATQEQIENPSVGQKDSTSQESNGNANGNKTKEDEFREMYAQWFPGDDANDKELFFGRLIDRENKNKDKAKYWEDFYAKVSEDPKAFAVLGELAKGTPLEVALGMYFDESDFPKEGDLNYEEYAKARQKRIDDEKAENDRKKAFDDKLTEGEKKIMEWGKGKQMDEETMRKWFSDKPYAYFKKMADGDIDGDLMEIFWKADQYDKDVESAGKAGEVRGRNEQIEERFNEDTNDGMPTGRPSGSDTTERSSNGYYNPFLAENADAEGTQQYIKRK